MRTELRRAPTWAVVAAVAVALVVLAAKAAGLAVLTGLLLVERCVAVVLVVLAWADEQASDRAGLAPLAGAVGDAGRWPR